MVILKPFLLVLAISVGPVLSHNGPYIDEQLALMVQNHECKPLKIPHCANVGYKMVNYEFSPFMIVNEKHATHMIEDYSHLFNSACAEDMKFFLCTIYAPICIQDNIVYLPPCRHVCEAAYKGCHPFMEKYSYPWPSDLDCGNFPEYTDNFKMCLFPRNSTPPTPKSKDVEKIISTTVDKITTTTKAPITLPPEINGNFSGKKENLKCECRSPFIKITNPNHPLYNKVELGGVKNCMMSCKSPHLSSSKLKMISINMTVWSVLCLFFSLIATCMFVMKKINSTEEKPLFYISCCYVLLSCGYLLRVVYGHDVSSCNESGESLYGINSIYSVCAIVFILTYYFSMAATIWSVVLSFCWFILPLLYPTRKDGDTKTWKRISKYSHFIAWSIPALQCVLAFSSSAIDGNPITGICRIGEHSASNLHYYVIIPLCVYILVSSLLGIFGTCMTFLKSRNVNRNKSSTTLHDDHEVEQMLAKLGIFLLVHVIPSAVRVACLLYDVTDERLLRHNCLLDDVTMTEVLMTETAMSTLTGLVSGVFVMTSRLSDVTSSQPTSGVDDVIIDCRVDRVVAEGNNRIRYDPIGKRRELHQLIL